jgi:putative aldouronate transport system permease protein
MGEEFTMNTHSMTTAVTAKKLKQKGGLLQYIIRNRAFYIMLAPGLIYLLVFKYVPMLGSVIAFQDYNIFDGFWKSPWVGMQWFYQLLTYPNFKRLFVNTLVISFYQLIFSFPAPIILACLLNELRLGVFKRVTQTILYLPHFLSWTLIFGLSYMMLSTQVGLINQLIADLGFQKINFLGDPKYFRGTIILSGIWKEMGWSSIIFLAALAGIDSSLYEAAKIDGAGRWKQFTNITFPGLIPAIMILLLLKTGHILDLGFEHIYVYLTPISFEVGDVLDTFSYRAGIIGGQYSFTTAIGLFKSVVGLLMLMITNKISNATTGNGLY